MCRSRRASPVVMPLRDWKFLFFSINIILYIFLLNRPSYPVYIRMNQVLLSNIRTSLQPPITTGEYQRSSAFATWEDTFLHQKVFSFAFCSFFPLAVSSSDASSLSCICTATTLHHTATVSPSMQQDFVYYTAGGRYFPHWLFAVLMPQRTSSSELIPTFTGLRTIVLRLYSLNLGHFISSDLT